MINKSAFWPVQPNNLSSAAETRNSNQTNIRNYVKCRKIVPGQVEKIRVINKSNQIKEAFIITVS
jgi:hypothetical protein